MIIDAGSERPKPGIKPAHVHLVLRHDQVLGRNQQVIHASITQVDLHDFCRLTMTYGLGGFHCVSVMEEQHRICREILTYWQEGAGKQYNPDRVQALSGLCLHRSFADVVSDIAEKSGKAPIILGTSAKPHEKCLAMEEALDIIKGSGRPTLVQFGTSWGLSQDQLHRCDGVLPPIDGYDGYNHLSVRCAAAIIVDRLFNQTRIKQQE